MHRFLVFSLSILVMSASALASDFPDFPIKELLGIDSDSGIRGPAYRTIVEELRTLEETYPSLAKVHNYGRSLGGRPLTLLKIQDQRVPPTKAVYVGGSIHGDEYLNIEDRLPRWFLEQANVPGGVQRFLLAGGVIYVAPILNPDGYDARQRQNRNGVDLNRDFTVRAAKVEGFKQVETRALFEFLSRDLGELKLEVTVDYHCCIGALLYPWSFKGPVLPAADQTKHLAIAKLMADTIGPAVRTGTTPVILGYSALGTSKDFYYEHFGARSFTYEGRRGEEDKFFEEHALWWNEILGSL